MHIRLRLRFQLRCTLKQPPNPLHPPPPSLQVIQHGACLGLGMAGLGTEDDEVFEDVKNVLYMDNAGGWVGVRVLGVGGGRGGWGFSWV